MRRCAEVHSMNGNEASEEKILSWVRRIKIFKKRAKKIKNPGIINMLMARGN